MKLPNAENAVVEQAKLVEYLLNVDHVYGGSKATFLASLGYSADNWPQLDFDIRTQLLVEDVALIHDTPWGTRYELVGNLAGPAGRTARFRSIWQIDIGTDIPRLITMYPG